jgi:hypothetical protein
MSISTVLLPPTSSWRGHGRLYCLLDEFARMVWECGGWKERTVVCIIMLWECRGWKVTAVVCVIMAWECRDWRVTAVVCVVVVWECRDWRVTAVVCVVVVWECRDWRVTAVVCIIIAWECRGWREAKMVCVIMAWECRGWRETTVVCISNICRRRIVLNNKFIMKILTTAELNFRFWRHLALTTSIGLWLATLELSIATLVIT